MIIKYIALDDIIGALQRMSGLTGRAGYAVMRTLDKIEPEYRIYNKLRTNLIKKYAPEGKNGIEPTDPGWNDFMRDYVDFLNTEVEIDPYMVDPEEYDLDKLYCETAKGSDYKLVQALIVREEKENADKPEAGAGDTEPAGGR